MSYMFRCAISYEDGAGVEIISENINYSIEKTSSVNKVVIEIKNTFETASWLNFVMTKSESDILKIIINGRTLFNRAEIISKNIITSIYLSNMGILSGKINQGAEYLNIILEYPN